MVGVLWAGVVGEQFADLVCFFFFQAEDGIRDLTVTGVQTCALPILPRRGRAHPRQATVPGHPGDAESRRRGGWYGRQRDRWVWGTRPNPYGSSGRPGDRKSGV